LALTGIATLGLASGPTSPLPLLIPELSLVLPSSLSIAVSRLWSAFYEKTARVRQYVTA
jgi:hypothetical protein